jgi:aspartate-semialdehyde dehydrogenase
VRSYNVGILGATGLVGQRLLARLDGHPWFRVHALGASERSVGRRYGDATRWTLSAPPPAVVRDMLVVPCDPAAMRGTDLVLSALDAETAREVEPRFAGAGIAVISNSSAFRMDPDVPLLVPEVNAAHLALLERQRGRFGRGFLVTNPNCSVTGLALAMAPLERAFGVRRIVVTTLQAISGAGAEGPRAIDLVDNVIPYIAGEEEKIEVELTKILGTLDDGRVRPCAVSVSAHCHRVATLDGHLEALSIELERDAGLDDVAAALTGFVGDPWARGLPSGPAAPIVVRSEPDRPQPRLDRDTGGGMSVVVGRIRRCPVLGLKLEILSHNAVRGAAGGTLLNAEILASRGLLPQGSAE